MNKDQRNDADADDEIESIVNGIIQSANTNDQEQTCNDQYPQVAQTSTTPDTLQRVVISHTQIRALSAHTLFPKIPSNRDEVLQIYELFKNTNRLRDSSSDVQVEKQLRNELPSVPPSYSTVMKQGPVIDLRSNFRSLEHQRINPFSTRIPPPSYAEIDNQWSNHFSHESFDEILLGPDPIFIWCRQCAAVVYTRTISERSKFSHFTAAVLCLFGCWPCCLFPYCMDSCKNTYHYCSNCNELIGTYRPWN